MGIIAETSLFTNTPGPNAAEGLEALRQNQLAIRELSGALPPENLTVVDGAISPTRSTIIIDTEGGAPADDLEVINPVLSDSTTLHDGMVIELVGKDDSRIVTVKHGSGQNQISLVDQEDIALSTQYALRLQWDAQAALWRQRIFSQPLKPATALKLGGVKVGSGITIAPDGAISIDPWNIFPMRVPIAVDGVKFGGSDGRRAIMPGETEPRENWVLCDGGEDGHGGTVPDMIRRIKERYWRYDGVRYVPTCQIRIYPDASGDSRRSVNASQTDIALLREAGFAVSVNAANPPVKDRINAMNAMFCNAVGERRYRVNPDKCPSYVEALEQQPWAKNGEPDKTTGHDHINDAAGYFIAKEYPIIRNTVVVGTYSTVA